MKYIVQIFTETDNLLHAIPTKFEDLGEATVKADSELAHHSNGSYALITDEAGEEIDFIYR